jgi:hypothetical protein
MKAAPLEQNFWQRGGVGESGVHGNSKLYRVLCGPSGDSADFEVFLKRKVF